MIEGDSAFRLKPHCCNLKASHSMRAAPGTRSARARPYAETVYPCRLCPSAPSLCVLQDTGFSIQGALLTIRQSGDQNKVRSRNSTRGTVGDQAGHPAHAMALDVAVIWNERARVLRQKLTGGDDAVAARWSSSSRYEGRDVLSQRQNSGATHLARLLARQTAGRIIATRH